MSPIILTAGIPVLGLSVLTALEEPNARGVMKTLLLGLRHSAFITRQSLPLPIRLFQ